MKKLLFQIVIIICFNIIINVGYASDSPSQLNQHSSEAKLGSEENPIKVGILLFEPYAFKTAGIYRGLVVDYWDQIAKMNKWHYEYIPSKLSFNAAAEQVGRGEFDILLGNLSTIVDRFQYVHFSRPFLINNVAILTNLKEADPFSILILSLISLKPIFLTIGVIFLLAVLGIWYESRKHSQVTFGDSVFNTTLTLLSGKSVLKLARSILLIIIFLGLLFKAILIGSMTRTIFDVSGAGSDPFKTKADIEGKTFIVNEGSAYAEWILELNGHVFYFDGSEDEAIKFYLDHLEEYDGVVTEQTLALYNKHKFIKEMPTLYVSGVNLRNDELVFYFNKNFPYRDEVDKNIVTLQDTDIARGICTKYFSNNADFCVL